MNDDESAYNDLSAAPKQRLLLRKLLELSANGRAPSVSEMTKAMGGLADSNTVRLLDALRRKGYVDRYEIDSRVQPRGTTLTERALKWLDLNGIDTSSHRSTTFIDDQIRLIPLYGPVEAGNPIAVENRVVGRIPLPAQDIPIGKVWVQGVEGRSMMGEDGILDGDQNSVLSSPLLKIETNKIVVTYAITVRTRAAMTNSQPWLRAAISNIGQILL